MCFDKDIFASKSTIVKVKIMECVMLYLLVLNNRSSNGCGMHVLELSLKLSRFCKTMPNE